MPRGSGGRNAAATQATAWFHRAHLSKVAAGFYFGTPRGRVLTGMAKMGQPHGSARMRRYFRCFLICHS